MKNIILSPTQKRMALGVSILALAVLSFWVFFYLPGSAQLGRTKSELLKLQEEVGDIERVMDEIKTEGMSIESLKARYEQLHNRFPSKEEESLRQLTDFARKLNLEIVSLSPKPKRELTGRDNKAVLIDGRPCHLISVTLDMKGSYKYLVSYLKLVRESLPAFSTVELLRLGRMESEKDKLDIALELNLYLSS